jgi:MoxR-like ATPase
MEKIKALPKRILLRGFDEEGRLSASDWALAHGVEVINMASLADLVVVGPQADASLLQKARVKGAKIVAWDQFQALLLAGGAGMQNGKKVQASVAEEEEVFEVQVPLEGKAIPPIEVRNGMLRVLDLELPIVGLDGDARVPAAEQFAHICLDRAFLETLRAVALGVLYGIPVALEGETAASKTSAILFLAHLLGQPVVRLNLSGHTDASELVGRYVPADAAAMIDWNTLTPDTAWLREDSRKILASAAAEGRALHDAERLAIIGREQFPVTGWHFQEGYLPRAMRHGWWILLDELNLAETQVLERLNCALENPPSLVLSEGSGSVFGRGGDVPVQSGFRVLATMNPAEYAGRAVLSKAFADRWGVWHQAAVPGEREIEQMLRCLVFGEHPRVLIGGRAYKAEVVRPVFGSLQAIPEIGGLLKRLAVFHHGIFRAAGGAGATPTIGRLNKERYSFSRRILLNLLRYVEERIRNGAAAEESLIPEAIQALYLGRIREEADRRAVNNILRAGGLI